MKAQKNHNNRFSSQGLEIDNGNVHRIHIDLMQPHLNPFIVWGLRQIHPRSRIGSGSASTTIAC